LAFAGSPWAPNNNRDKLPTDAQENVVFPMVKLIHHQAIQEIRSALHWVFCKKVMGLVLGQFDAR